jgi:hypothetical protein
MWFKSCSNSDTLSWIGRRRRNRPYGTLVKKRTKFSSYKEIQMGSGAKSYMRKGFPIYEEAVSHV